MGEELVLDNEQATSEDTSVPYEAKEVLKAYQFLKEEKLGSDLEAVFAAVVELMKIRWQR